VIITVTLNPCVDFTFFTNGLHVADTNRISRVEKDAGGKGINVSRIVAELGGETLATGFLGGPTGLFVRHVLDTQGAPYDFVEMPDETRINFSIEPGDGPPTTFNDRGPAISEQLWSEFCDRLQTHLKLELHGIPGSSFGAPIANFDGWLEIGGSIPPGLPESAYADLVRLGRQAGAKVCLDADGEPMKLGLAERPHLIKPNAKEASRAVGVPVETPEDALRAADMLRSQADTVIVSLGASGAVLCSPKGRYLAKSPKVEAISTIGSGDSLIAGYLWAIEAGKPVAEALAWGCAAGAATACTNGAEIGRRATIERLLPLVEVRPA
jgi:1-phosphofructokinase